MTDTMERAGESERLESGRGMGLLWLAVLTGPMSWFLALNLQYSLVRVACTAGAGFWLHLVTLLSLALVAGGGGLAWTEWRRIGGGWHHGGAGTVPRSRFMCIVGMMSAALFGFAILAQWLGALFLHPCMGI